MNTTIFITILGRLLIGTVIALLSVIFIRFVVLSVVDSLSSNIKSENENETNPTEIGSKAVRWCPECGAVVVDADYDCRTNPGYYRELQYPNITKKYGLN